MTHVHRLSALALGCFVLTALSGCCVGPMACGPQACGPVALGHPCDGCGECEGCGELYVDPWINHPPDCCDPCDSCGNYNGQSCGQCRTVFSGVKSLWGYRCGDDGCNSCDVAGCDGGCVSYGGCGDGTCDGCSDCGSGLVVIGREPMGQETIVKITNEPTPARQIAEAIPGVIHEPYPHRTRRIFKARTADGELK